MNKYLYVFAFLVGFVLLSFVIIQTLDIRFLSDPTYILETGGLYSAVIGILFLSADILMPIPSSIIMIGNAALFGIWVGALLSIIGMLCSNLLGFYIGRKLKGFIHRLLTPEEIQTGENFIQKWGLIGIVLTRSVPILSESVIIIAGTSDIPLRKTILPTILGLIPAVLLYSLTGAYAISFDNVIYSFLLVLLMTGVFWLITLRLEKRIILKK